MASDVEAVVTVADDSHTGFMPTYLPLAEVRIAGGTPLKNPALVIYHGGKRGVYFRGDCVRARGRLARFRTPEKTFESILVTNMDDTEKV